MSGVLVFLLGPTIDAPVRWARLGADGRAVHGRGDAAEAIAAAAAASDGSETVTALLPGELAACRRMPAAPIARARLVSAARNLMEDELAEPIDGLAVGAAGGRSLTVAFALASDLLEGWKRVFLDAGLALDSLSTDYLALGASADRAVLIAEGGRVVAGFAGVGFAIEAETFATLGPQLFKDGPLSFKVIGDKSAARALPPGVAIEWAALADEGAVLVEYARAVAAAPPPNFLPPRLLHAKALRASFAPWRRAAGLAAGLALVACVAVAAESIRDERVAERWRQAARAAHLSANPEAANEDPVAFARRRLAAAGPDAALHAVAARLAAATNGEIEIDRLRFDAARGDLTISVKAATDTAIEGFKTALAGQGIPAQDSGGFRRDGDLWAGDLTARLQ